MRTLCLLALLAGLLLAASACSARTEAVRFWNEAVAALEAGDLQQAEISAEKAAARGGREFAARREFLQTFTAMKRSAAAEARASIPGAAVSSYARALASAEEAGEHGRRALHLHAEDWPAARRNLERNLAQIARLRELYDAALRDPAAARPPPPPKDDSAGDERLLERLGSQEKQKRVMRRRAAEAQSGAVEQDW
jgi:hypothetical protein